MILSDNENNTGILSVNKKKLQDPKNNKWMSDAIGRCTIEGKKYYINGYIKTGKHGRFTSLKFVPVKEDAQPENKTEDQPNTTIKEVFKIKDEKLF